MKIESPLTAISTTSRYAPTIFKAAFPGTCLPVDDVWLNSVGFARITSPSDYTFDDSKQQLTAIQPAFNAATGLWDVYAVQVLSPVDLLTLTKVKVQSELDVKFTSIFAVGFKFNGVSFQIDDGSLSRMLLIDVAIVQNISGAYMGSWTASDNSMIPMDTQAVLGFFAAVFKYVYGCKNNYFMIRASISAAKSADECAAIDITAGWPTN